MTSTIAKTTIAGSLLMLGATVSGRASAAQIIPDLPSAEYTIRLLDAFGGDHIENNHSDNGPTYAINRPWDVGTTGQTNAGGTKYTAEAKLSISNDHLGSVSASAKTQNFSAGAAGGLLYSFTVIGPAADYVPVTISGSGSAEASSASGFAHADAEMRVNYLDGLNHSHGDIHETFSAGQHHPFSDTINIAPNAAGRFAPTLSLFAEAGVGYNDYAGQGYYAGSASASIDPLITIADPVLARLYTIEIGLSDVVILPPTPSVPNVPLPKSLPLFGMALLVGTAVRRLRRGAAAR